MARVAPFVRPLKKGAAGKDVEAIQIALRHWYRQHNLPGMPARDGKYGPDTAGAVAEFQKRRGIRADERGVYGKATHKQLSAHMGPTALKLLLQEKTKREKAGPEGKRAEAVATAMFAYNRVRNTIRYTQGSLRDDWLRDKLRPPKTPVWCDCSSFATWCYWVAGLPDPSAWNYRAVGWTGSMTPNGKHVPSAPARPAALVYYPGRSGAIGHVAIKVSMTHVVSFGSEPMRYFPTAYRTVAYAIEPMI